MCVTPCLTCSANNFYTCTTCDTTIGQLALNNGLCLVTPTWYIELAGTCMLGIFILFPLMRKRSMVLMKLFDMIQIASFFKYLMGFIYYRHNYLYLQMRGILTYSEGFNVFSLSNDSIPIYLNEETYSNKLIRIASLWALVIIITIIVGIFKSMCGDAKLQFTTFMNKNISNALCIAFYISVQDMSFFSGAIFNNVSFQSTMNIIYFGVAIIFSCVTIIMVLWMFCVINYDFKEDKDNKLYNYQNMFCYRMDYDLFQTYNLTNLPTRQKKIKRYSNLGLIDVIKKIGYGFYISSYLYHPEANLNEQVFQLIGFIFIFDLIWYIGLAFDQKKQVPQLIINILGDLILIALLVFPLLYNDSSSDLIYMILCLSLFGLALLSAFLQIFLDLYTFLPYDLYNIGLTIVIEDKELIKELQRRKKQQDQINKKLRELQQENERLRQQAINKKTITTIHKTTIFKDTTVKRNNQSEQQLDKPKDKNSENEDNVTNENIIGQAKGFNQQQELLDDDELNQYRIDMKKKRNVYSFDKKIPFVYSNKLDQ